MPEPDTRRFLLVGASGRVGRMVLSHWHTLDGAAQIVPQYRATHGGGGLLWDPLDGPQPLLDASAAEGGFDAMIVLAGVTPGGGKPLELNRTLAEACLSAAEKAGIFRVLLASSSAVYGVGDGRSFSEQAPCNPVNDYGRAKLDMEQSSMRWRDRGLDLCLLRIGNVAGADALLLSVSIAKPDQKIEIDIFADGQGPLRSYIGPRTLASVLARLCGHEGPLPLVLNVAAPVPIHMDALANAAKQPWIRRNAGDKGHQNITLNCKALSEIYAFEKGDSDPATMVAQWKGTFDDDI